MIGDCHVRFLGEGMEATLEPYLTQSLLAVTYHNLGMVAQELREWEEARRNYREALEILIEYGDRFSQATTYHCLGNRC